MADLVEWHGDKLTKGMRRAAVRIIRREALAMIGRMKRAMTQTVRDRSRRKGRMGYPSAPGHPPAVQRGVLRQSLTADFSDLESEGVAHVGATGNAPYAIYLELGTYRMAPRPFLRPEQQKAQENILWALDSLMWYEKVME